MGKTVTISVSTKYVKETVTLQELGIDENMDDKAIKKTVEEYFRDWLWNNVSFSYIIK
ncbi:hypothetical protein C7437_102226 [Psychrobacillus insolitus]|uniref:Uncharacterized protein n=1 Tax=Psychrobacillus insolitus TaxID=1461 RepID=A0A2W7MRE3_9BACI|nr:hypothetical protein [Psychrobacillus insolitus]PZX05762.1 hypothetical protein C7437_102226 [Psychrobacillus insolitus]